MRRFELWFVLLLIVNFLIVVVYLILGWWFRSKQEGKTYYFLKAGVMLLCPLVGPLFFGIGYLNFRFLMHRKVDLSDVIFSKERTRSLVRADEEREKNMVPLEEALVITDKDNLRNYMLNVLRGNVQDSLAAISMALNSEDSETSHYAASVLRDELNSFRVRIQKIYAEIKRDEDEQTEAERLGKQAESKENEKKVKVEDANKQAEVKVSEKQTKAKNADKQAEATNIEKSAKEKNADKQNEEGQEEYNEEQIKYCCLLLDYMNPVLEQRVFTDMEQTSFAQMLDETAEILYTHAKEQMLPEYYEWACLRQMECGLSERAEIWGKRSVEEYPKVLSSYTCLLKLYFTVEKREQFFEILTRLKQSKIVVDSETLELMRVFD